jgi:hypothetical protein
LIEPEAIMQVDTLLRHGALVCLLLPLASPAQADLVLLKNGDRLSGKIDRLQDGKLALTTKYAGQLLIRWPEVQRIESEQPLLITLAKGEQPPPAGASLVEFQAPQQQRILVQAQITDIQQPAYFSSDFSWKGNLDLSLDLERDEDSSDNLRLKTNNEFLKGYWRNKLDGSWEMRKTNGVQDKHNYNLTNSLDYFWSSSWFWRGDANLKQDFHNDLYLEAKYGSGPGYRFYDNKSGRFELGSTLGRQSYLYHDNPDLRFSILTLSWDYRRFLLKDGLLELYTNGEYSYPFYHEVDFAFNAEAGMRLRLSQHLRSTFSTELDSLQGTLDPHNDWKHFLGLGYSW